MVICFKNVILSLVVCLLVTRQKYTGFVINSSSDFISWNSGGYKGGARGPRPPYKNFFGHWAPTPYLRVWMTAPPPHPPSLEGLDPPLWNSQLWQHMKS